MSFLLQAIARPGSTGAVAPSSQRLARLMVAQADLAQADVVVELGPGSGAFTRQILPAIRPGGSFLTLEINPAFAARMRAAFPSVTTIVGSAENLGQHLAEAGHDGCDRVVSSLPWTAFAPQDQERILTAVFEAMHDGGRFLTYAYVPFHHLRRGRAFRDRLHRIFRQVEMTPPVLNLPPAFVYVCTK